MSAIEISHSGDREEQLLIRSSITQEGGNR
jgi:hypothetical protein